LDAQQVPLVETVEVRVASIDVVVTDAAGRPIRGIPATKFRLLENGASQQITNFSEITGATSAATAETVNSEPAPLPPRYIQVFVDEYSIDPLRRAQALRSLSRTLKEILRPGDEVSLVSWVRRLNVDLPSTSNHQRLFDALESAAARGGSATSFAARRREIARRVESLVDEGSALGYGNAYSYALTQVRFYREEVRQELRDLSDDLKASLSTMRGLEGRKILILVGNNLPLNPGIEMFELADRAFEPFIGRAANSTREAIQRSESLKIEAISQAANANGVSIYAIAAGSESASGGDAAESALLGLSSVVMLSFTNSAGSLQSIASGTGGMASVQANTVDGLLATVARDLGDYYSLGYRPSGPDDRPRSIEVSVDVPGAVVRNRKQILTQSAEESMGARALACLFREACDSAFPVYLKVVSSKGGGRKRKVNLELRVPMSNVTLLRSGAKSTGGFVIDLVATTRDGVIVRYKQNSQRVSVPDADLPSIASKYVTWTGEVVVAEGPAKIVAAVSDEISQSVGIGTVEVGR
jgi:VWFA-related protein